MTENSAQKRQLCRFWNGAKYNTISLVQRPASSPAEQDSDGRSEHRMCHSHHETTDEGAPVKLDSAGCDSHLTPAGRESPSRHFNIGRRKLSRAERAEDNCGRVCAWPVARL